MSSEDIMRYPTNLNLGWGNKKGTWTSIATVQGIAVYLSPDRKLDGKHYLFKNLIESFRVAGIHDFKVYDSGRVYFLAPHGMKYGFLLGAIAKIYSMMYDQEDHY